MLGFLDESGDTGLKVSSGSSPFFVVALVTFDDDEEALRCDQRIGELRGELGVPLTYEFHFAKNTRRVRERFLQATASFNFRYHVVALNKLDGRTPTQLGAVGNIYEFSTNLLLLNARPFLRDLILVMDKRGDRKLRQDLARSLRNAVRTASGEPIIKRIKQQDSHRNNLLQLADYVASIESRALSEKLDGRELATQYLRGKEITRDLRPK